jgi:DNA (cytosine-5)-methyltransferase 1
LHGGHTTRNPHLAAATNKRLSGNHQQRTDAKRKGSGMRYGSVCSGIEAATVAWASLHWKPAFFSEVESFPRAVLGHHYPTVPRHGDFTTIQEHDYDPIDLLIGGTPCQSFSIAGLRKGFADQRGNLTLEFIRLAQRLSPRWLVWENVPGILSQDRGRAFAAFLGGLAECGYGFAYRVLDAQYFGVPQRRRRVFLVAHLGDWRPAAAVLFEPESLCRDLTPGRQAGEKAAAAIGARSQGSGGGRTDVESDLRAYGGNNQTGAIDLATAVNSHDRIDFASETFVTHTLRGNGFDASEDGTGRGTPLIPIAFSCKDCAADAGHAAPTLRAMTHHRSHANAGGQLAVLQPYTLAIRGREEQSRFEYRQDGIANALLTPNGGRAGIGVGAVACFGGRHIAGKARFTAPKPMVVRRLTPRECERLQGFPDDYTLVSHRGKPAADGPRYKALGNSFAVPVVRWIGERIQAIHDRQLSVSAYQTT